MYLIKHAERNSLFLIKLTIAKHRAVKCTLFMIPALDSTVSYEKKYTPHHSYLNSSC